MVMKDGDESVDTIRELKAHDLYPVLTNRLTTPLNKKGEKHCTETYKG